MRAFAVDFCFFCCLLPVTYCPSTASSFREVSAKRRPGVTLCFFFQSKGHTICKKALGSYRLFNPAQAGGAVVVCHRGLLPPANGQQPKAAFPMTWLFKDYATCTGAFACAATGCSA